MPRAALALVIRAWSFVILSTFEFRHSTFRLVRLADSPHPTKLKTGMTIILQGESIGSESDFHRALSQQLDLGSHYGRNLAALWDRLTTDVERPLHLIWKNASLSRTAMGDATFHAIVRLLQDVERQDGDLRRTDIFTFSCA